MTQAVFAGANKNTAEAVILAVPSPGRAQGTLMVKGTWGGAKIQIICRSTVDFIFAYLGPDYGQSDLVENIDLCCTSLALKIFGGDATTSLTVNWEPMPVPA